MPATLIEVDLGIAKLRKEMATHGATLQTGVKLDALIQERAAIITNIANTSIALAKRLKGARPQ